MAQSEKPHAQICVPQIPLFLRQVQVLSPGPRKQRSRRRQGIGPALIFEKLGLITINLEMLPHFRDWNDRTLPDHLYDEIHEDYDISECTMVKTNRFARYMMPCNKLQAKFKKTDVTSSRVSI
ncbi:hypothetical protein TNCV_2710021 [Trichonephila clavipes]|nr:hypothetical protein TNCV_2710021 [Trichonephila clavipes]